jgi:hypothetical protein
VDYVRPSFRGGAGDASGTVTMEELRDQDAGGPGSPLLRKATPEMRKNGNSLKPSDPRAPPGHSGTALQPSGATPQRQREASPHL